MEEIFELIDMQVDGPGSISRTKS